MPEYVMTEASAPGILKRLAALDLSKPWTVSVQRMKRERSLPSNSRLWLLHDRAADETGESRERMHEICCGEFFGWTEGELFGRKYPRPIRTTTRDENGNHDVLPQDKFNEFMTFVENLYINQLSVWLE